MDRHRVARPSQDPEGYFRHVRSEILPLLPSPLNRVLEVGCGTGETLAYLKKSGICSWTAGIEKVPEAAASARGRLDLLIEGNIEEMDAPVPDRSLDAILCLDVLEHLIDPWRVIPKLHRGLKPGGVLIASIPNVRFYKVVKDLLFHGRWDYADAGILDRTHLRFFTRESAVALLECSGMTVDAIHEKGIQKGEKRYRKNRLTLGLFKDLFVYQYLLRARNGPN